MMKKTLSFFLAAIMLFAFSSVAFAADVNFELTAYVNEDMEDEIEAVDAGDTFVLALTAGSKKIKAVAAMFSYDNSAFEILVDEADLGSHLGAIIDRETFFTFGGVNTSNKKVEAYVTIKVKESAASGDYDFEFLGCDEEFINGANGDVTYACDAITVTVNGGDPVPPTPSVNMVSTTEIVDVQKADTVAGEATDYQYGSAIGIKGTTGDAIFKKMIWAITVGSDRLYSKAFPVSLEGDFEVAATFINGNKVEENNVVFSDAGAIFTDGVEDYFTNEADADNKKEKAE